MANVPFANIFNKKVPSPWIPIIKCEDDTSNFGKYDDSNSEIKAVSSS